MTELEIKQAIREGCHRKGNTWMLSGPAGQMEAHCSRCGGAAPKDATGKTKLTNLCPHCGERLLPDEEPREQRVWWDDDYDPDVDDPMKDLITPSTLIPGDPDGSCLGNGLHEGYACMCDGCDYEYDCWEAHKDDELLAELQSKSEEDERWLRVCRVKCLCCGDVLERTYKSPEDYGGGLMTCKCGKVSFDPSPTLWRVIGHQENYEVQNELAEE